MFPGVPVSLLLICESIDIVQALVVPALEGTGPAVRGWNVTPQPPSSGDGVMLGQVPVEPRLIATWGRLGQRQAECLMDAGEVDVEAWQEE